MITALGGGVLRDVLLGALPPTTFSDVRYLAVAAAGGLIAFGLSRQLERLATPVTVFDALGLSLFAVTGADKALGVGSGIGQAVLLGTITAVGGGTIRDVLVRRVPTVLSSELYAIPALLGATVAVLITRAGVTPLAGSLAGAGACLVVRLLGVGFRLNAPRPRGATGGRGPGPPEPDEPGEAREDE